MTAGALPIELELRLPAADVRARSATVVKPALIFAICFVAVIGLQRWTGAYDTEVGRYSDDAAHFMNGLLIRDYVTTGLGQNPMTFAEDYYLSYPKIAPLMWPPLFHVVLGMLLLVGGSPGATALLLVAATAAWLLWRLHNMIEELAGSLPAVLAAGLTLVTPLVTSLSGAVMLDVAIAAIGLEAVYWLSQFAQSGSRRHAVLFGVCAACACLTKGNGVAVLLTPFAFILVTGRYDLLRSRGLYLAAAIVLFAAMPILAISARFDAAIGDFGPVTPSLVLTRIRFYGDHLWIQLGPLLLTLCAVGTALAVVPSFRRAALAGSRLPQRGERDPSPIAEALASLALATMVFHSLVPHRVAVSRYLTMAIAPLIGLGCVAAWTAVRQISHAPVRRAIGFLAAAVIALGAWASRPSPYLVAPMGYRDMIAHLGRRGEIAGARLLVVSDEFGEGAFVTEAARLGLQPAPTMIRGSKLLASDDWGGRFFQLRYASSVELMKDLEDMHVAYVLVDAAAEAARLPYFAQIMRLAETEPIRFAVVRVLAAGMQGPSRSLTLFRVTRPSPGQPKPIEIQLKYSIGKTLTR